MIKTFLLWRTIKYEECSRMDFSNWWKIAKQLDLEKKLERILFGYDWVALQGEICGEGIQGNIYNIKGLDFYGYNLIYPNVGKVSDIALRATLDVIGLKTVPYVCNFQLPNNVDELVEMSKGESALKKGQAREGIVVRNYEKNISFKVISPSYLLKSNR